MTTTPLSLLQRLQRNSSQDDWRRFASLYTPLFFYWSRQFGVPDSEAPDLIQDVLTAVWRELPHYERLPDKRFRGWLFTIARRRWLDACRKRSPTPIDPTDSRWDLGDENCGATELEEREYQQFIVQRALQLMQNEYPEATWKACWETVVEGRDPKEVARQLSISLNAVYLAKSRVLRRLRQDLSGLIDEVS